MVPSTIELELAKDRILSAAKGKDDTDTIAKLFMCFCCMVTDKYQLTDDEGTRYGAELAAASANAITDIIRNRTKKN